MRAIDCDPKQAAEAAARVFALNAGLVAFQQLRRRRQTDQAHDHGQLAGFGRKCLQDSGLISKDSTEIGARLSGIDMNRDDKAHRFVVTWNAFLDGNRLAYLALTLAIGVSSCSCRACSAPRRCARPCPTCRARRPGAHQLEAIIEAALPDIFKNARLALGCHASEAVEATPTR